MSSGWAAWPDAETTYRGLLELLFAEEGSAAEDGEGFASVEEVEVTPVTEGGRVDGMALYVYGRVVAEGRLMKGETVRGTCMRSGWESGTERWLMRTSQGVLGGAYSCHA